ncbi:right-handed parallel beta-helix repeat-containing protein, partial [Patescibacteria group bacterium]|nr:right-handed parallel beta-helix repeat-containing protein [Patescibacteria group bacterium]
TNSAPFINHCVISNNYGGIKTVGSSSMVIANNTVSNNSPLGGIRAESCRSLTITKNEIAANTSSSSVSSSYASSGGGIYCSGGTVTITDNQISGNSSSYSSSSYSSYSSSGGGIYCSGGTVTITDNQISGNSSSSSSSGGGIYCDGGAATITNNQITDNTSSSSDYSSGGGIYCSKVTAADTGIAYNKISNNSAGGSNPGSGGVYISGGKISFGYNIVTENTGHGIYTTGHAYITLSHNNIYNNEGYSVINNQSPDIEVTNNWWGTADENAIILSIWDRMDNNSLGIVNYYPFLTAPEPTAGPEMPLDTTPPTAFDLLSPANNSEIDYVFPTFTWEASLDLESGIAGH